MNKIIDPAFLERIQTLVDEGSFAFFDAEDKTTLLSPEEREIVDFLAVGWNLFCNLETMHPDETNDFRKAIHDAQRIIMARPVQREFNSENV